MTALRLRRGVATVLTAVALTAAPLAHGDTITELVAAGRSLDALPLALEAARARPDDAEAWRRALQIALWNSRDDEALEALASLVRLDPARREWRFELARRLLWRRRLTDAEPHARWLARAPEVTDATALEVAFWVLSGVGDRDAACRVARRWIELAPNDARARWALADLAHWSSSWREARAQYAALVNVPAERTRAHARLELLRRDHPDELVFESGAWCDSIGVQYVSGAVSLGLQLPSRWVLRVRAEGGRWSQGSACGVIERALPNDTAGLPSALGVANLLTTARYELTDVFQPELQAGVEADGEGNVAPIATAGFRLAAGGKLFGRAWLQHDRYRASLASAHDDVRLVGGSFTLYAEPARWFFASSEGSLGWLDDGNVRARGMLAAGVHNTGRWQIEPRAFGVVEWFDTQRPTARPYFTPSDPWSFGGDLTARYAPSPRARVEVTGGAIMQAGEVAFRGSFLARVDLGRHARVSLTGGYVGSPLYRQLRADLGFTWIF